MENQDGASCLSKLARVLCCKCFGGNIVHSSTNLPVTKNNSNEVFIDIHTKKIKQTKWNGKELDTTNLDENPISINTENDKKKKSIKSLESPKKNNKKSGSDEASFNKDNPASQHLQKIKLNKDYNKLTENETSKNEIGTVKENMVLDSILNSSQIEPNLKDNRLLNESDMLIKEEKINTSSIPGSLIEGGSLNLVVLCFVCKRENSEIFGLMCDHNICIDCLTISCVQQMNAALKEKSQKPEFYYRCPAGFCEKKVSIPTHMIILRFRIMMSDQSFRLQHPEFEYVLNDEVFSLIPFFDGML